MKKQNEGEEEWRGMMEKNEREVELGRRKNEADEI